MQKFDNPFDMGFNLNTGIKDLQDKEEPHYGERIYWR
jgi:hypothetical protein